MAGIRRETARRLFLSVMAQGQSPSPPEPSRDKLAKMRSNTECQLDKRNGLPAWKPSTCQVCLTAVWLALFPGVVTGQNSVAPNGASAPAPNSNPQLPPPFASPITTPPYTVSEPMQNALPLPTGTGRSLFPYPGVRSLFWPMPSVLQPVPAAGANSLDAHWPSLLRGSPYFTPQSAAGISGPSIGPSASSGAVPAQAVLPSNHSVARPENQRVPVNPDYGLAPALSGQRWPPADSSRPIPISQPKSTLRRQAFDPMQVQLRQENGRWRLVIGQEVLKDFAGQETEAMFALHVIRFYRLNERITIGEGDAGIEFWLSYGQAPRGRLPGQQTVPIAPQRLRVVPLGNDYWITDGRYRYFRFPRLEDAQQVVEIIQRYGFTQLGIVGRPQPVMLYWLAD